MGFLRRLLFGGRDLRSGDMGDQAKSAAHVPTRRHISDGEQGVTHRDVLNAVPAIADVSIMCAHCGALVVVRREELNPHTILCLGCGSRLRREDAAKDARPPAARAPRIRLYWDAGYVSEYPDPLDEETRAVTRHPETHQVMVQQRTGLVHHFVETGETDDDDYTIYREIPPVENRPVDRPGAPPRVLLAADQTFDLIATVPATDRDAPWTVRCRAQAAATETPAPSRRLVGWAPHLQVEKVGQLRGGGPLSP